MLLMSRGSSRLLIKSALRSSSAMQKVAPAITHRAHPLVASTQQVMWQWPQVHGFATKATDDNDHAPLPKKTYEELEAEVAALQKELAALKEENQKSKITKFLSVFKQYGPAFLVWWTTLYVGTGVGLYFSIEAGLLGGADALDLIKSLGIDRYIDIDGIDPKYGNIGLAVLLNEIIEPVRFPLALATIPTVKRVFGRKKAPAA